MLTGLLSTLIAIAAICGLYLAFVNTVLSRSQLPAASPLPAALLITLPMLLMLLVGAGFVWWKRQRLTRDLNELGAIALRWATGDASASPTTPVDAAAMQLALSLRRLALQQQTNSLMLREREEQLAVLRTLGALYYWETDAAGRYTRIDMPTLDRRPELGRLLGRMRWDDDATLLAGTWDQHRDALARRAGFELTVRRRAFSGGHFIAIERGQPRLHEDGTLLGYAGTLRDITAEICDGDAQRLAMTALAASTEATLLIEETRAQAGQPAGWRVIWSNRAAARAFDRSGEELAAQPVDALFLPSEQHLVATIGQALRIGRALKTGTLLAGRYGDPWPALLRLESLADQHSALRRAILSLDRQGPQIERLSHQMTAAEQLRKDAAARSLDLEVMAKELESFSYTVSHDLRAPLRVIEGFARIVQEDYSLSLDRMGTEHLSRILSAAHRMNAMIDALLALSRLTSKPVVPEEVDLSQLATSVIDELRSTEPGRAVSISIKPGMLARGDQTLLRVVIQNLLSNAWKYTSKAEEADIGLTCEVDPTRTVYCVWDNGVGFDMRFADRLFGVFQRLHSPSDFPGTGVGLATVQRIIRRHGGRIWAQSEPGAGARFYFTLWEQAAEQPVH